MPKLRWRCSYETMRFNTPDGELDKGQYAVFIDGFLVREHPKNNRQPMFKETLDTAGLTEVTFVEEGAWYHEYFLSDGRIYRVATDKIGYDVLKKESAGEPLRSATRGEETQIKKDDDKWL